MLKQKKQEQKERKNELDEIKKYVDKIKRENLQQTKNSNIEKENNIKTIKKLQEEKDTLKKQVTDLNTLNLGLETNLHRQQNKKNPSDRTALKQRKKQIEQFKT